MHSTFLGAGLIAAIAGAHAAPATTPPAASSDDGAAAAAVNNAIAPMSELFDYSPFTESRLLKFSGGATDWNANTHLNYQFKGGKVRSAQMDTGSVGMVIAAGNIPGYDAVKGSGRQDVVHYEPSGNTNFGEWVQLEVTLPDIKATATVEVLAVTQKAVCPGYNKAKMGFSCPGATDVINMPTGAPSMMGVGFRQGAVNASVPAPKNNPLVNIASIDGKPVGGNFCQGYVLTKNGVHIGLTKENTAGFEKGTMKLKSRDDRVGDNQWSAPRANLKINDGPWVPAPLLIDTGLNTMLSSMPDSYSKDIPRDDKNYLLPGNPVEVAIGPDPNSPIAQYKFSVGEKSVNSKTGETTPPSTQDLTPNKDRVSHTTSNVAFVNTGSRVLRAMDAFYDAKNGYFGLRSQQA